MKTLAERLIKARMHKGWSQPQFAALIPMKQQSLFSIEKGDTKNPRFLEKMAKVLEVSEEWLKYGINAPSWLSEPDNSTNTPPSSESPFIDPDLEATYLKEYIKGRQPFFINIKTYAMESQNPDRCISPGQTIIVDPDLPAQNGDLVLAKTKLDNEIVFRQYQIEGKKITLEAFNLDKNRFPSLPIEKIEKIIGVVIFHGSLKKKAELIS
jgi:SOS-response transcriptional repressor LexA